MISGIPTFFLQALLAVYSVGLTGAFVVPPLSGLQLRSRPLVSLCSGPRHQPRHISRSGPILLSSAGLHNAHVPDPSELTVNLQAFFPSAPRIVALGDVHGGSKRMMECLRTAGIADEDGDWCGEDTVLVQVGDILDRGHDEAGCVDALLRLRQQARKDGGNVILLLGNHEVLNADGDFRYAAPGQFGHWKTSGGLRHKMSSLMHGKRRGLFKRGGGAMANVLASCPVVVQIGDTVFCHGGLTPQAIEHGFQALNDDTSAWMLGRAEEKPALLEPVDAHAMAASPLWERAYGMPELSRPASARLDEMLAEVDATRMVVGHTPQVKGVNGLETSEGNQVWRVDVALAERVGRIECLELAQDADGVTRSMAVIGPQACLDARLRLSSTKQQTRQAARRELFGALEEAWQCSL